MEGIKNVNPDTINSIPCFQFLHEEELDHNND